MIFWENTQKVSGLFSLHRDRFAVTAEPTVDILFLFVQDLPAPSLDPSVLAQQDYALSRLPGFTHQPHSPPSSSLASNSSTPTVPSHVCGTLWLASILEFVKRGDRKGNRAGILAHGACMRRSWMGGQGGTTVGIRPQNTPPHVVSIRNNLVFLPTTERKGVFSCTVFFFPLSATLPSFKQKIKIRKLIFKSVSRAPAF